MKELILLCGDQGRRPLTARAARPAAGRADGSGWRSRSRSRRQIGPQTRLKPRLRPSAPNWRDAVPCRSMSAPESVRTCAVVFARDLGCTLTCQTLHERML